MGSRSLLRWCSIIVVGAAAGCGSGEAIAPSHEPPASLVAVSQFIRTGTVGALVAGDVVVQVFDASNHPVQGASVAFTVTLGNGTADPRIAITDGKGLATTKWTLGTVVGGNEISATIAGVSTELKFEATAAAGPVSTLSMSTRNARMLVGVDSMRITARALDLFGNATSPGPTYAVRDQSLLSVDASGLVRALRRGASTYLVATVGNTSDSALVTVLAPGQSICTGAAQPIELAVGQVLTNVSSTGVCVHSSSANAEYALVPFYNNPVVSATTQLDVRGQGIAQLSLTAVATQDRAVPRMFQKPGFVPDDAREMRMRTQERTEGGARLAGARRWQAARQSRLGATMSAQQSVPAVGDILKLNADATHYCDTPDIRAARVMAVTNKAIVVADTNNPAGGFTQDEYRSIGVTFDTLVDPLDRHMFGDPSDIDNNGHVILFFTRAVNELSDRNSSSLYLGFFYARDLFPKVDSVGTTCTGSNVGEMFYLLVPDTGGVVSKVLSKDKVTSFTLGTVAHEYQHLINASRRMYINKFGANFEEKWLDEGLAHSAEELNFYASSGLKARSNLDLKVASTPAYSTFMFFNQSRYASYLSNPELQAPIGSNPFDDDVATRGAIWSFLRYSVDRLAPADEQSFWFKLVNSKDAGLTNIANALGVSPSAWLRDWAISVFLDDNAAAAPAAYQQPSWNMRNIISGNGLSYPLVTRLLSDDVSSRVTLAANGVSFLRFSVANGQDALLTVNSAGAPAPSTVQLALVRVR